MEMLCMVSISGGNPLNQESTERIIFPSLSYCLSVTIVDTQHIIALNDYYLAIVFLYQISLMVEVESEFIQ